MLCLTSQWRATGGGAVDVETFSRARRQLLTSAAEGAREESGIMHSTIHNITFDCADARAQAMFWAAVTAGTAQERDATPGHVEYVVLPLSDGMPRLYFQTVPEPKPAKNRVHLDVSPDSDDKQAELARLVGLGATVTADQPPDAGWIVMADPEGNEFCLD